MLFAKSFLHPNDIEAKSIFPSDFMTLREMIDLLVFVETLIQITLATWGTPQDVPFMRLCGSKPSSFKNWTNELVVESEHLVQELTVFNVVALLVAIELHGISDQLLFCNVLEHQEIGLVLAIEVTRSGTVSLVVKESRGTTVWTTHWGIDSSVWDCGWASSSWAITVWHDTFAFIIELLKLDHDFTKLTFSFFFLNRGLADRADTLAVHEVTCTRSSWVLTADAFPVLLEIWLDVLQTIESWHLAWFLWWSTWLSLSLCWSSKLWWHLASKPSSISLCLGHILSSLVSLRWVLPRIIITSPTICIMGCIWPVGMKNMSVRLEHVRQR